MPIRSYLDVYIDNISIDSLIPQFYEDIAAENRWNGPPPDLGPLVLENAQRSGPIAADAAGWKPGDGTPAETASARG